MIWAGHRHLTVNVNHPLSPGVASCRNAHRRTKTHVPQINMGEAVNLPNLLTRHIDHDLTVNHRLPQLTFRTIMSFFARIQSRLHITRRHKFGRR